MDATNQEVQRQLSQGHQIDWAQVSQAVGLDVLKCLEICQVDNGKARWTYDPNTFSWEMADRMKTFIADNYPAPATPNFRAVSNYMWIARDDCIHMSDMLKGNIVWTDEIKARVVEMRRTGMPFNDIGKQLSPNLSAQKVAGMYHMLQRLPLSRLSPETKQLVRAFVDKNAGRCVYQELQQLSKMQFGDIPR
ncbi:hypothetical protein LPJ61_005656, partial [Coemansia biformis]